MGFLRLLEGIRLPAFSAFFSVVTYFGDEIAFMLAAFILFWCVDKRTGYYAFLAGLFGTIANQFLKIACRIPRPWVLDPDFTIVESARAAATGYSFPSGHTQNAVSTFGAAAVMTKRRWVRRTCIALVVLVPFSRMYLGVHTPLDVGVAFLMAAALLAALYPAFRTERAMHKAMPWLLAGALAFAGVFLGYVTGLRADFAPGSEDASNLGHAVKNAWTLTGAVLALLPVYFIEKKYVRFEVRAVWYAQVLKVVLGLGLVVAVKTLLKAPQTLRVMSYDGKMLSARFLPREDAKGTILLFHGYRSSGLLDFGPELEFLHRQGYNLLLCDQRAHGASQGRYMTFGVRERYDVLSWVTYLAQMLGAGHARAYLDRKSTRLNSSHSRASRMPSSA